MHRFRPLALLLCLTLCLPFASCARQSIPDALSLVLAMAAADPDAPAGDIYLLPDARSLRDLSAVEGMTIPIRVADNALLLAAFGANGAQSIWQCAPNVVEDGAMRLATAASPLEWMAFRCVSRADTAPVAELLLQRLEVLRRQYRGSDNEAMLARAEVVVIGKYVLLIISSAPEAALDAARQALS